MVTARAAPAPPSETSLEDPNSPLVVVGQILCILVPLVVWFTPTSLEPVTQHAFAIVGFMVVAWITRAMDYALAGLRRLLSVLGARHRQVSGRLQRLRQRYRLVPVRRPAARA